MIILQLGCYQMNIKKHVCCARELLREVRVWQSLLMLLTLLEIADECEASNVYISFIILTALSENKQVWVYPELFARLSQSLSNVFRTGHFHHCNRWELGYLYLVFLQIFQVTLSGLLHA